MKQAKPSPSAPLHATTSATNSLRSLHASRYQPTFRHPIPRTLARAIAAASRSTPYGYGAFTHQNYQDRLPLSPSSSRREHERCAGASGGRGGVFARCWGTAFDSRAELARHHGQGPSHVPSSPGPANPQCCRHRRSHRLPRFRRQCGYHSHRDPRTLPYAGSRCASRCHRRGGRRGLGSYRRGCSSCTLSPVSASVSKRLACAVRSTLSMAVGRANKRCQRTVCYACGIAAIAGSRVERRRVFFRIRSQLHPCKLAST